jgi:hypothetical protein
LMHWIRLLLSQQNLIIWLLGNVRHLCLVGFRINSGTIIIAFIHTDLAQRIEVALLTTEADPHLEVVIVIFAINKIVLRLQPRVL